MKSARIIAALTPLPPQRSQISRRVQFFGFMECGFLAEGRLGAAMRANRAAAESLRGNFVDAAADGKALTPEEAIALPPVLHGFGWRLLEREAELLDMVGRTNEAVATLDAAAAFFGNDSTRELGADEQFYAFKLLAARAYLKDFLGEKETALSEQRALMESKPRFSATGHG